MLVGCLKSELVYWPVRVSATLFSAIRLGHTFCEMFLT